MDICQCAEHAETYWGLMQSGPHWAMELTLEFLSGLVGVAVWPLIKKSWRRWFHRHDSCCSDAPHKAGTESPGPF
jgi:hypothetical protein